MRIAIIGAGVSGLTCAQMLRDKHQVRVFEKEATPGGLIRCRRVGGSLFHTCGGHIFNSKRQEVLDWFWSKFDREEEFTKADRNSVVFMPNGAEIPYPIENHAYLMDAETQKAIVADLIKMAKEEGYEPENFEDFLKHRFGETLYRLYFKPYNEKVWRRDLRQVSLSWLEGKLPMPTVAEIIYNNMNHVKEKAFVHATFWYEKRGGSQLIADRLAEGIDVTYNAPVETLAYDAASGQWTVGGETFDRVIYCGNIKEMVRRVKGVDVSGFTEQVEALAYHGTTSVFCEIEANPYSWIYLPSTDYQSHRIICTGNFSPTNNAEGKMTATVEFADAISVEEIERNLAKMPLKPRMLDYQYNPCTYPIQDAKTRRLIQALKQHLAPSGLYFTGRFADWEYYNMDVAMGAAMDLCKLIP